MNPKQNQKPHYWEKFVNALSTAVLVLDVDGIILYANKTSCTLLKKKHRELIGTNFSFPIQTAAPYEIELLAPKEQIVYAEISVKKGKWKQQDAFIVTLHDITLRKAQEQKLKISANVFNYAKEGIVVTDEETNIVEVNKEFSNITGYKKKEVLGKKISILSSGKQDAAFYKNMWSNIQVNGYWYGEIWNRKKDGELYPQLLAISEIRDEGGDVLNYVGVFYDISQQEAQKRKLQKMAHYDSLTNLPNRVLFSDRLELAMKQTARSKLGLAVIFMDLDDFKSINDQYSHYIGDQLLKAFVSVVSKVIRDTDTLARYGGDEFLLLVNGVDTPSHCYTILNRIYEVLQQPIQVENHQVTVSTSIGVTLYPQLEDVASEQLIRQADQAMYQSKLAGKNQITMFNVKSELIKKQGNLVINELRIALKKNQLKLYFQPKINMQTSAVIGVEALIRWEHPTKGLLLPNAFIPCIKHDEFLLELTQWTINTALKQLEEWRHMGIALPMSINIDAMQIEQTNFIEELKQCIAPYSPSIYELLEFEILETSIISNVTLISNTIKQCAKLGITFSLDDFGTGVSSINYLVALPFKYVKIDMYFVKNLLNNPRDIYIFKAMVDIAKAIKVEVIAEGVETQAHVDLLLELKCKYGQGVAFSKALPEKKLISWYKKWQKNREA